MNLPEFGAILWLTVVTVVLHVSGCLLLIGYLQRFRFVTRLSLLVGVRVLLWVSLLIIVLHLFEVAVWAWFYVYVRALDDFRTALYVSMGAYSTVGFDAELAQQWELVTGVEAMVGVLMFGVSTALIFTILHAIDRRWQSESSEPVTLDEPRVGAPGADGVQGTRQDRPPVA